MQTEVVLRLGVPELGLFVVVVIGMFWWFRAWFAEAAGHVYRRYAAQLQQAQTGHLAELRREAERLIREVSEQISGTRRSAVAKVYGALRNADLQIAHVCQPRQPLKLAGFTRQDVDRLMQEQGVPSRSRENILEIWAKDRDNAILALERQLATFDLDRAAIAIEEARATALLNELFFSESTAVRLRDGITALARRYAELRQVEQGDRRAELREQIGQVVDDLSQRLRAELAPEDAIEQRLVA